MARDISPLTRLYLVAYKGVVVGRRAVGKPYPDPIPDDWVAVDEQAFFDTALGETIAMPPAPAGRPVLTPPQGVLERLARIEAHLGITTVTKSVP